MLFSSWLWIPLFFVEFLVYSFFRLMGFYKASIIKGYRLYQDKQIGVIMSLAAVLGKGRVSLNA